MGSTLIVGLLLHAGVFATSAQPLSVHAPAPVLQGGGFPGTPVGPDRTANPYGAPKTSGTTLKITAPSSVTVGDAFFAPRPMSVKVVRPIALAKTPVKFTLVGAPAGLTVAVAAAADGSATVSFKGFSSVNLGESTLQVKAVCGAQSVTAPVKIVRKRARILLVDDDYDGNNYGLIADPTNFLKGKLSVSDALYRRLLDRGDGVTSLVYDAVGVDQHGNGPDAAAMEPYDFVLWYLGRSYGGNPDNSGVLSGVDETNARAYLSAGGGRTFLLAGPGYLSNVSRGTATSSSNEAHWVETDSLFMKKAMGLHGARGMLDRFNDADLVANGETFMMGKSPTEAQLSPVNPDTATPLVMAEMNPDMKGKRMVPVATWNKVGDANMIYLGFTLENVTVKQEKLFGMMMGIRVYGMGGGL